jgi:hypothetical protein
LDYQDFCRLLDNGATQNCIFKKECKAFSGSLKDETELAKEIIALSNNETAVNYIIIGVSDDGSCRSVDNRNLTDDNLQNFCKENIAPIPVVKLKQYTWQDATEDNHKNKIFVIIKVEAQARQCFRFNQEFINTKEQCFIRNGEVWVRHDTETYFATPEEIKKLFEKKLINKSPHKINYANLPYAIALPYILDELEQLVTKAGGKICSDTDPFIVRGGPSIFHHIVIPMNGKPLLLRVVPVEKCIERGQISTFSNVYLTFEHGILLISLGEVAETATDWSQSNSKENWGWFCTHEFWHPGLKERNLYIPLSEELKPIVGDPSSLCFVFANTTTNESLRHSWAELLSSLNTQSDLIETIETNRSKINIATASYLAEGCPLPTNKKFQPKTLLGNEVWDPKKYGQVLLNRQPELCNSLRNLVDKMES